MRSAYYRREGKQREKGRDQHTMEERERDREKGRDEHTIEERERGDQHTSLHT